MKRTGYVLILLTIIVLAGCASKHATQATHHNSKATGYKGPLAKRLNSHLQSWKGAPYRLGGLSKRGIDCSGFVFVTYRDVFKRKVARTTERLSRAGHDISRSKLKFGDLVFFKTGRRQRHVGIYVGGGKFIHASTSKGVMTSQLNSRYWNTHYWKSIRMN